MLIALMFAAMLSGPVAPAGTAAPATGPAPAEPAAPAKAAPTVIDTSKAEIRVAASKVVGVVPQGKDDEIVCRKEQLLGSRLFKTVCEQKSVAEERRILERDALRHIQDLSMSGAP